MRFSLNQIKEIIGECDQLGETTQLIINIASLERAKSGDLSFLGNTKYKKLVKESSASVILLPKDYEGVPMEDQVYLRCMDPSLVLGKICQVVEKEMGSKFPEGVHRSAVVEETAVLGKASYIGPNCYVGANVKIGEGTILQGNVYIAENVEIGDRCFLKPQVSVMEGCKIGNEVTLHNGVVVGSDGFGYAMNGGKIEKLPHIGIVVIEDEVEVGANTTIDRAKFHETRIKKGSKIDNLVQIGHNVEVGRNCFLVAQSGISGSTVIGDYCMIGGQAGVGGHIELGSGTKVAGQSGLLDSTDANTVWRGTPAIPFADAARCYLLYQRLPDLFQRVKKLEKESEMLVVEGSR